MELLPLLEQLGDGPFKAAALMAFIFGVRELQRMRKSVEKLNLGVAVVVEKVNGHEKRLTTLERKKK